MRKKKDKKKNDQLGVVEWGKREAAKQQQGSKKTTPPTKCPKCGTETPGWQTIGNDVRCQQCGHQITVVDTPPPVVPSRKDLPH